MDDLDDLPVKDDSEKSPHESNVMNTYFNTENPKKKGIMTKGNLIFAAILTLIFALLGNTWTGSLVSKIPYLSSPIVTLGVQCVFFFIFFFIILKFVN